MSDIEVDGAKLMAARYGTGSDAGALPPALAALLDRRVTRRYKPDPVPGPLLETLLAAAQSAPAKSDLQQYSVVVMRDPQRIKRIADWIGTMDWICQAPVFLVWCGDMRRGQRMCEINGMPHANNNLDTFLNTAVDCALAMGHFMAAADAASLGTCPISYVRSHIERVTPLLGLPPGVYPVAGLTLGWPEARRHTSMRLPQSIVVHHEHYDDANLPAELAAYDERRSGREPLHPNGLKNHDIYGPKENAGWSENCARQLSVPERFGFAAYLKTRGFDLA
jgi:FMN reductase [NAD(P)H]